jgi:hypothetical protein
VGGGGRGVRGRRPPPPVCRGRSEPAFAADLPSPLFHLRMYALERNALHTVSCLYTMYGVLPCGAVLVPELTG